MTVSNLLNVSNESIDYLHHAKQWEESGMNQIDYCHSQGINYSRFVHTRSKLAESKVKTKSPKRKSTFIPVRASSCTEPTKILESINKNNTIILRFSKGSSLEFPVDLNQAQLSQLFKALETIL